MNRYGVFFAALLIGISATAFGSPAFESSYKMYLGGVRESRPSAEDKNQATIFGDRGFISRIEQKNGDKTEILREYHLNGALKVDATSNPPKNYLENGIAEELKSVKPLLTSQEDLVGLIRGSEAYGTDRLLPVDIRRPSFDMDRFIEGDFAFYSEGLTPTILMRAAYKGGIISGDVTLLFNSGVKKFEGKVVDGVLDGDYARFKDEKGKPVLRETGSFSGGLLNGVVTLFYKENKKYAEVTLKDGILDGPIRKFHQNGKMEETCQFASGVRLGECKVFSEEGKVLVSGNYDSGRRNGKWEEWYENGQNRRQATYSQGSLEGEVISYHSNGKISRKENYRSNKLEGEAIHYNEDGSLKGTALYANNQKSGLMKIYYPSGKLELEVNFKNGFKEGIQKRYYETGELLEEINFARGKQVGFSQSYYKTGVKMGGAGAMDSAN
jgi:antitoxin component YwqK of YwqJK toxin-antitoxin module